MFTYLLQCHGDQANNDSCFFKSFKNTYNSLYIYISCECIQLRSIVQQIWELCRLSSIKDNWILLYEDNVAYIIQI